MVIQESGGVLDAIKHLDMYKENIFDKLTVLEIYGKLLLPLSDLYFSRFPYFTYILIYIIKEIVCLKLMIYALF